MCFIACSNGKEQSFNFDESKSVVDLLTLPGYESLNRDEKYKEYISDFFEVILNYHKRTPEIIGSISNIPIATEENQHAQKKKNKKNSTEAIFVSSDILSWVGNGILSTSGVVKDVFKMGLLDLKKEQLYVSFSEEKRNRAINFQEKVIKIIDYYNSFFDNEVHAKISYKYLKPSLREDSEAMKLIEPMFENADKFFVISMEVKSKVAFNYLLSEQPVTLNYSRLVDYGLSIISSNGIESIRIDTPLLNDYFNALNNLTKSINELEKANFKTPIEDWSIPKRASYEFSIKNMKEKTLKEVKSLNEFDRFQ